MGEPVVLFQERWRRRPFWMLVGCILVNRTRWAGQAERVHASLMRVWPSYGQLAHADERMVYAAVAGLGLGRRRAKDLVAMAGWYARMRRYRVRPTSRMVERAPGCGPYAAHSWAIFIEGSRPAGVTDKKLKAYLRRKRC